MRAAAWHFLRTGRVRVSDEVRDERLAVCRACPYGQPAVFFDPEKFRTCSVCTCLVEAKARLATEECPKNLWPR
jgi:hypothetical protein